MYNRFPTLGKSFFLSPIPRTPWLPVIEITPLHHPHPLENLLCPVNTLPSSNSYYSFYMSMRCVLRTTVTPVIFYSLLPFPPVRGGGGSHTAPIYTDRMCVCIYTYIYTYICVDSYVYMYTYV